MKLKKLRAMLLSLITAALLCGCDNDSNGGAGTALPEPTPTPEPVTMGFEVQVTNLTHNQPLSPLAVAVHGAGTTAWTVGEPSSAGLELLAESGDNSGLLMELEDAGSFASESAAGPLGPGASETLSLTFEEQAEAMLTLATMLVNTNDAFAGVTAADLSSLAVGESLQLWAPVYDAGTEFNSEMAGTIPGPADGGEGFNAARDDSDFVARHPGVVTRDDGYPESVLDQSHRFDQPAVALNITRVE